MAFPFVVVVDVVDRVGVVDFAPCCPISDSLERPNGIVLAFIIETQAVNVY